MVDLKSYYDRMENNEIIFAYKGIVTTELIKSILKMADTKMEAFGEERMVRKRVYSILIELLQNLIHHTEKKQESNVGNNSLLVISRIANCYQVATGNLVTRDTAVWLKSHIDRINSMTPEELRSFYNEVLTNEQISDKGGAGLGIIDIARKSKDNKVNYNFKPVNDSFSFFSLFVYIQPTKTGK